MNKRLLLFYSGVVVFLLGCGPKPRTFGYDLDFLRKHDTGLIVLRSGDEEVVVSPKYQGKVFTSTVSGDDGPSFGWIHYKAFEGPLDAHMNAYGGENRLWLGPEGGRFSLFFPKDAKMEFANWKTPSAFDTEPWEVMSRSDSLVVLRKDMQLVNYAGTRLSLSIDRWIGIMDRVEVDRALGLSNNSGTAVVGYRTENLMTNMGSQVWTDTTGMPCVWMLDMFNPSPSTTIVIPYSSAAGDTSKPTTTDYFGEIQPDRIKYSDGVLYFKADGKSRGKLGIHPGRAKPVAGSYDAASRVLTIISFDVDPQARYLNQEWNTTKPPFSGDAVNAYNDGPLADGSQMGPFYELESVSPAAFLGTQETLFHHRVYAGTGETLAHQHAVYHFTGSEEGLNKISQKVLGASINQIKGAFH
ncbi:MAG TPA: DUF6786 family protein [Puia sp.]|jgi:hypothetical protein|nr:DUF6786 family protein [Puia sp.]